jgi:2-phosphosulfolactate phosphatase
MDERIKGKSVVLTTTNGTKAITIAKEADGILIGSFLNLKALSEFLIEDGKSVLIQCAGWKNRFNLEDTLFAGALVEVLTKQPKFSNLADSALASAYIYSLAKNNMFKWLENSSHRNRLKRLNLEKDIKFCLQVSLFDVVPYYRDGSLINKGSLVSLE